MTADEFIGLLKQGGVTVVVLGVILFSVGRFIARAVTKFFDRLIASLDAVGNKLDRHTTVDLEHHAEVKASVVRVETKLDAALDWQDRTPVEGKPRTDPRGIPAGYYGPRRPSTRDESDR